MLCWWLSALAAACEAEGHRSKTHGKFGEENLYDGASLELDDQA